MFKLASLALVFSSAFLAHAQGIEGIGNIFVLNSSSISTATPNLKVGCIDPVGKFINPTSDDACGVFTPMQVYPNSIYSQKGNCTFHDTTQEANTDSKYGSNTYALHCYPFKETIYEELYTVNGFKYPFLCNGDNDCFFDAKKIPTSGSGESVSLWTFEYGSEQEGITPGHVKLQLLWNKLSN